MDDAKIKVKDGDEREIELDAALTYYPDGRVKAKIWPESAVEKIVRAHAKRQPSKPDFSKAHWRNL